MSTSGETPAEIDIEPTLAAMRAAAEHARAANHAAHDAPRTPGSLYDRTGALYDLLIKTEQLADSLGKAVRSADSDAMFSDDGLDPALHRGRAGAHLLEARARLTEAHRAVNDAWNALSHLGAR